MTYTTPLTPDTRAGVDLAKLLGPIDIKIASYNFPPTKMGNLYDEPTHGYLQSRFHHTSAQVPAKDEYSVDYSRDSWAEPS